MALNTDPTSGLYSPQGVTFQDNLRIGAFSNRGLNTVGYGVEIGNTQAYSIKPAGSGTMYTGDVPNNTFFGLGNYTGTAGPVVIPGLGVKMDVSRLILITCTTASSTYSIRLSGYDMYNQEFVTDDKDIATGTGFYTGLGVNILTSIYFYNFSASSLNFQINQTDHYELPYADQGQQQRLQSVTFDGQPQRALITNSATPYGSRWGGNYINGDGIRPIFQVTGDNLPDGNKVLTFVQDVDSYGFKFDNDPYQGNNFTYPNDQLLVTGATPNNTNWTGWMG